MCRVHRVAGFVCVSFRLEFELVDTHGWRFGMRCAVGAPGAAAPPAMDGFTRTFSGGPPRGPPPTGVPGAGSVTPLRRPDLPLGGGTGSRGAAGPPAAEDPHTLSHGSGWSSSTPAHLPSQLPNPEKFVRDNCIWDLDKNTYSRMKMRWLNTLQREWHPDVSLVFQGKLNFEAANLGR